MWRAARSARTLAHTLRGRGVGSRVARNRSNSAISSDNSNTKNSVLRFGVLPRLRDRSTASTVTMPMLMTSIATNVVAVLAHELPRRRNHWLMAAFNTTRMLTRRGQFQIGRPQGREDLSEDHRDQRQ